MKRQSRSHNTSVLIKSRRRCCLCCYLHDDFSIKRGQIAHIDQDRNNNHENNLAFLCLDHHDEYDGVTSESKGITRAELIEYRDRLYRKFGEDRPLLEDDEEMIRVRELTKMLLSSPSNSAQAILDQLVAIFDSASNEKARSEALFRIANAGFESTAPFLFSVADDETYSFPHRQRAMIGLCEIYGSNHPMAVTASIGNWLRWWNEKREGFTKLLR